MDKHEFLTRLREALRQLPHYEIDQSVEFYAEMIDDRVEEGFSEEQAVASLGDVDEIARHIIEEMPVIPKTIAKAKTGSRMLNIVLLVVCSPIWVPLVVAFALTVFSIYLAIWMVILSLWLAVVALALAGLAGVIAAFPLVVLMHPLTAVFCVGFGLALIGISLFCFFGVLAVSKGLYGITKAFVRAVRSLFVKEGGAQ